MWGRIVTGCGWSTLILFDAFCVCVIGGGLCGLSVFEPDTISLQILPPIFGVIWGTMYGSLIGGRIGKSIIAGDESVGCIGFGCFALMVAIFLCFVLSFIFT